MLVSLLSVRNSTAALNAVALKETKSPAGGILSRKKARTSSLSSRSVDKSERTPL